MLSGTIIYRIKYAKSAINFIASIRYQTTESLSVCHLTAPKSICQKKWLPSEDQILLEQYKLGIKCMELQEKHFPYRSYGSVSSRLRKLKLDNSQSKSLDNKFQSFDDKLLFELGKKRTESWEEFTKSYFPMRDARSVASQYYHILAKGENTGKWTKEEENVLQAAHEAHPFQWDKISEIVKTRTPRQCRLKWQTTMNPSRNQGVWTPEEDKKLLSLYQQLGNSYSAIGKLFDPPRLRYSVFSRLKILQKNSTVDLGELKVKLDQLIKEYGENWDFIQRQLDLPFSQLQLLSFYLYGTNINNTKLHFTDLEDQKLLELAEKHNYKWKFIAAEMRVRSASTYYSRWKRLVSLQKSS